MKKLLLLSLSFLMSMNTFCTDESESTEQKKLTAKDLQDHALFWANQLPKLSKDEIALLANYLYFESLMTNYECDAREALLTFHTASIYLNKQLMTSEDDAKTTATNTALLLKELKEELFPARNYAVKAYHACLNEIEKSDFTTLKKVVISFQQYSRAVIAQFIKQDKPTIENVIQNCKKSLEMHLKKMGECESALQAIIDGKNPYIKEGMNVDTADMDVAISAADTCLGCMNEMTLACATMRSMSVDMLRISLLTDKLFYQMLYDGIKKDGKIDILFDENGLIDEDDRDETLPSFDNKKITIHKRHLAA